MPLPFTLSPDVAAAAESLDLRFDGVTKAGVLPGGSPTPALAHFTVIGAHSPAFRASFTVRLTDLSPGALRAKYEHVVANFAEPAACAP